MTSTDYTALLPDHVLSRILSLLDWRILRAVLEAFPTLKENVVLCRDPERGTRFFDLEGLTVLDAYPQHIHNHPVLHGRRVLLILLELSERDLFTPSIHQETFTPPIFESSCFKHIPTFIYHYVPPGVTPGLTYSLNMTRLLRSGHVNLLERNDHLDPKETKYKSPGCRPPVFLTWYPPDMTEPLGLTALRHHGLPNLSISGASLLSRTRTADFTELRRIKIKLMRAMDTGFRRVRLSNKLRELHIHYRKTVPRLSEIDFVGPMDPLDQQLIRHFSLIDLDSELCNKPWRHARNVLHGFDDFDLGFLSHFQSLEFVTPATYDILQFLSGVDLSNVKHFKMTHTALRRCPDGKTRARQTLDLPNAETIQFSTRSGDSGVVPTFNAPKLKELHLRVMNQGRNAICPPLPTNHPHLEVLVIHGSGCPKEVIRIPSTIRQFSNLKRLELVDVYLNWLHRTPEDMRERFLHLQSLKLVPAIHKGSIYIRAFTHCLNLTSIEVCNTGKPHPDPVSQGPVLFRIHRCLCETDRGGYGVEADALARWGAEEVILHC